jgi:MoaA/NifB/PqqE/SkfB family radical SAM enzyme
MDIKEVRHLLTLNCNLRCKHCYLSAGEASERESELSQEDLDEFYGFFKPDVVSATGGEPLLRKDLVFRLARSVGKYGGAMELVTNGFFLTPDIIEHLGELNPNVFYQISLDGSEMYHNHIRGHPNAYQIAMNAIDMASASGAKTKVRLTATDENFDQIPEIIEELDKYNRPNIQLVIRPIVPVGRAEENGLAMKTSFSEFEGLNGLAKVISVETTDNMGKCGCGVDTVAVNPNGEIFPCTYFVDRPKYKMGTIGGDLSKLIESEEFKNYDGTCYARHMEKLSV